MMHAFPWRLQHRRALRARWLLGMGGLLGLAALLNGCGVSYLWHVSMGQLTLLQRRQPVAEVLAAETGLSQQERQKLQLALEARTFAITQLGLHASKSYTTFVQLDTPYVSYNLSAAAADALRPYVWWFPFVGAVPYKGFFDKAYAEREQRRLVAQGYDTYLRGIRAYSTLGYFHDPIFSSMLEYSDFTLINTIIHEMVHQTVWIKGSVSFNESLANFIAEKGTLAYLTQRYGAETSVVHQYQEQQADAEVFAAYMHGLIGRVETLYQQPLSRDDKLRQRQEIFADAVARYPEIFPRLKTATYRQFFAQRTLNNALLLTFRVYHRDTSFFDQALAAQGGDLRQFIAYCRTLRSEQIPATFRTR